jgi:uncharacterized protein (DUF2141 family)
MTKFLIISYFLCLNLSVFAQTGTVVVNVKDIQTAKGGEISAGIFKKENFPKVGKQLIGQVKPVAGNELQIIFTNVPVGDYGVVAFQDIDKNKELKSNFVGYPTEPIGFSNDAKIKFGPPAFDDARVKVESNKTLTLTIKLR